MNEQEFLKVFMMDSDIFREDSLLHVSKSELRKIYKEHFSNQLKPQVRVQIAELKQNITKHFDSEIMLLENSVEDTVNYEEYKIRKKEIRRQKFYMMLILSNLST
jgi:hypothetical protein